MDFDKCIIKYEGCMKQLKKAEKLLDDVLQVCLEVDIHLGIEKEIREYFNNSKYYEVANERSNNEITELQPRSKGNG